MSKLPVGIQLYGLRDLLEEQPERFEDVMCQVKAMGYNGVEMAGLYGLKPEYIRAVLDKIGLKAISAHVPLVDLMDNLDQVMADYKVIGCNYLVVPYQPEQYRPNAPEYEVGLKKMTEIGQIVAKNGFTLLYHNHDFEFVELPDGRMGYDDMFEQTPADALQCEPDTCWITVAGQDAAAYVRKYAGRNPIVHLKDFILEGKPKNLYKLIGIETEEEENDTGRFEFRSVGFGNMVWEPVLAATLEAGSKWVIVEQDEHYNLPSLECARRSREYLRILGW